MITLALRVSTAACAAVEEGCRRFDAARFFEAHEAWEDAWRVESGEARRRLQGLIQIAAGFHKGLVHGRPAGMAKLLGAGLAKLGADDAAGLARFRAEVDAWRDAAREWAGGGALPVLPLPRIGSPG